MAKKKNKSAKSKADSPQAESNPPKAKVENTAPQKEDGDKKSSKMPLILGAIFLILLLMLAGTGIFLGLRSLSNDKDNSEDEETIAENTDESEDDEESNINDSASEETNNDNSGNADADNEEDITNNDTEETSDSNNNGNTSSDATELNDRDEDEELNEDTNSENSNMASETSEVSGSNDTANIVTTSQATNTHNVIEGDTLWQIAERTYGSGFDWVKILNANSGNIGFLPNGEQALIIPGQVLIIP